jgi:hypothetical protein
MARCHFCGFENSDGRERCIQCKASLKGSAPSSSGCPGPAPPKTAAQNAKAPTQAAPAKATRNPAARIVNAVYICLALLIWGALIVVVFIAVTGNSGSSTDTRLTDARPGTAGGSNASTNTTATLPPLHSSRQDGGVPFLIFRSDDSSFEEQEKVVPIKDTPFDVQPAAYTYAEAMKYLQDNGFKYYRDHDFMGLEAYTYYQGGEITNRTTYEGTATVIVTLVPSLGWFRIL